MQKWSAMVMINGFLQTVIVEAENRFFAENILVGQYGRDNVKMIVEAY